jgi:hypothetical protein
MLKWPAWLLGGTLTFFIIAYLALLLINWRDQPPSEAALRLAAAYRDRPAVSDIDNAWVYVMGFAAGPEADPHEAGVRRVDWLRKLADRGRSPPGDDPVPDDESYKAARLPAAQNLSDACRRAISECTVALAESDEVMREWIRSEKWLLDRYHILLRHPGWHEVVPFDASAPLPSYALVFEGQKLLISQAYLLAGQKDAAGVRKLLGNDVTFWRHVLASSDILITKMIAVAALNRSFEIGNLVLRRLPAELQLAGMPQEWTVQLTDAERSLLRCFTGEWIFGDALFRQTAMSGSWASAVDSESDSDFASRLLGRALMPMFQPQDTSNRRAEVFIRAADAMSVPFEQFPEGLDRARADFEDLSGQNRSVPRLYNPVGDVVLWFSAYAFHPYGARVMDVEGVRRAAVLAAELRSRKVDVQSVPAELAASRIRAPYSGDPFAWDFEAQTIVFVGLEPSERGRHAFSY